MGCDGKIGESGPRRNIELKTRLADFLRARATAERLATDYLGIQRQVDTYFQVPRGRLKLRQFPPASAQLIGYVRPLDAGFKGSDYWLVEVADGAPLREALAGTLGVLVEVVKEREIFLIENVRVHLDRVEQLGEFLEFEAVLGAGVDDARGRAQLAELVEQFALPPSAWLAESYSDLMLRTN